jgi:hypothetical protein
MTALLLRSYRTKVYLGQPFSTQWELGDQRPRFGSGMANVSVTGSHPPPNALYS